MPGILHYVFSQLHLFFSIRNQGGQILPHHSFKKLILLSLLPLVGCSSPDHSPQMSKDAQADLADIVMSVDDAHPDLQGELDQGYDSGADLTADSDVYVPPELTESQQRAYDLIIEAYKTACELEQRCTPTVFESNNANLEDCVLYYAKPSFLRHEMPHLSFSVEQAQSCLTAWEQAECFDSGTGVKIQHMEACNVTGSKQPGESCYNHFACDSGFCNYAGFYGTYQLCGEDPVCLPAIEEGQPCTERNRCPPLMECVHIQGVKGCYTTLKIGEQDCRVYDNAAFACEGFYSYCEQDTGVCTPYVGEGESCANGARCNFIERLHCQTFVENPVCERTPDEEHYLLEGAPCRTKPYNCIPGTVCYGKGYETCQKPLPGGSVCDYRYDRCVYDHYCNRLSGYCEPEGISNDCLR